MNIENDAMLKLAKSQAITRMVEKLMPVLAGLPDKYPDPVASAYILAERMVQEVLNRAAKLAADLGLDKPDPAGDLFGLSAGKKGTVQ